MDRAQAEAAGRLRLVTRAGRAVAGRARLPQPWPRASAPTALTTDRPWAGLDCGIAMEVVR